MISFLLSHLFYPKKRMMILISLGVITLFLALLTIPEQPRVEQLLFQNYSNVYYHHMMGKTIKLIMPFLVILCVTDHDQAFLKPIHAYFGRSKVALAKLMIYPIILLFIYMTLFMIYHILPSLLTSYYLLNDLKLAFFISLYLDGIILTVFVLFIIREKYKAFSILFSLFYMLFSFIQEDLSLISLYYLFPFENHLFDTFRLAYLYKLCYIIIGFAITHHKLITEPLK